MQFFQVIPKTLQNFWVGSLFACSLLGVVSADENIPAASPTASGKAQKEENLSIKDVHGTQVAVLPLHFPTTRWFARGDLLLWKANEDGLQYVRKLRIGDDPLDIKGNKKEPHFDWDWGCRVAAGMVFGPDKWDLTLNWTHLINEGDGSSEADDSNELIPDNVNYNVYQYATKAHSHVHLNFNTLDLELGKNFFVSRNIAFHPHIGLRGAWIRQRVHEKFDTFVDVAQQIARPTVNTLFDIRSKADNKFAGGGLRAGLDSIFHFDSHLALFARGSASLIYGRFHVYQKLNDVIVDNATNPHSYLPFKSRDRQEFDRVRTNIEGALGLQWEQGLYSDKYHITVGVAYEIAEWFGQNQLEYFTRDVEEFAILPNTYFAYDEVFSKQINGDLALQGVSLKLQFDF